MRNAISSKQPKRLNPANLGVIFLLAGQSRTMQEYGHKSLLPVNGTNLINYQLKTIKNAIGAAEVWAVLGHEREKLIPVLNEIRTLENPEFATTNTNKSIALALRACPQSSLLFIYGDLLFNSETLGDIVENPSRSYLVYENNKQISYNKVGVSFDKGIAHHLTHGIEPKWGQIIYLTGQTLTTFRQICYATESVKLPGYELLNKSIEAGGVFYGTSPQNMLIKEVDAFKDINIFKKGKNDKNNS